MSRSSSIGGGGGGEQDGEKLAAVESSKQLKRHADENTNEKVHAVDGGDDSENDDDDEGWVPPMRDQAGAASNSEGNGTTQSTSSLPTSERIETILEVSRQVKEQERLDRAIQETEREAEALFQLTEEEQASLTDEEILERLTEVLKREEELEEEIFRKELEQEEAQNEREKLKMKQLREQLQQQEAAPDWLQTRRALQGNDEKSSSSSSSAVSVIHHTQLTANEIKSLLEEHRGRDITIIEDDPEAPRMGGAAGMIFCTGGGSTSTTSKENNNNNNPSFSGFMDSNPYLISTLSRVLIDHMKDRKLHEIGTAPSAQQNTKNRSPATQTPSLYGSSGSSITAPESWKIVDCGNYIVHILDEATRKDLRLEDLWSGIDPLWRLNILDEEAVDDYCARNPVPAEYDGTTGSRRHGRPALYGDDRPDGNDTNTNTTNDSSSSLDFDGSVLKRLQRNQFGFTRRHRPVIPQATKNRNRRAGRKQRRLQKERAYFGDSD